MSNPGARAAGGALRERICELVASTLDVLREGLGVPSQGDCCCPRLTLRVACPISIDAIFGPKSSWMRWRKPLDGIRAPFSPT